MPCVTRLEPLADDTIGADVGTAEPVDGLLRIADDEQRPWPGRTSCQSTGLTRSASGDPDRSTTISACSGSVSWNSSTNRCDSRSRNVRRTSASSRSSSRARSSRSTKSSAPSAAFSVVVALEAGPQVLLQGRRQVGVGATFELAQRRVQLLPAVPDGRARVPSAVRGAASLARLGEPPVVMQVHQQRFQPVEVVCRHQAVGDRRRAGPRACRVEVEDVFVPGRSRRHRRKVGQARHQPPDLALPIERVLAPRAPDDRAIRAAPCRRDAGARPGRPRRCRRRSSAGPGAAAIGERRRPDRASCSCSQASNARS